MKKFLLIALFFLKISYFCYSQGDNRRNKIEAVQIAYLTQQLDLTPDEAQKFWPVYNSYRDEVMEARKGTMRDEVLFEEKVLEVKKKYKSDFRKILGSDERVNRLFVAERSFREMLRKELLKRRMGQRNPPD